MFDSSLFSRITSDYYTRRYELKPEVFKVLGGKPVTIYAECSPNILGVNNEQYFLEIYFSVDTFPYRYFIVGVTFGEEKMDKEQIDEELDSWVDETIKDKNFPKYLQDYMKHQKLF